MKQRIYLDNNASTHMDPYVIERIQAVLGMGGNPSSVHYEGQEVRKLIDASRRSVADYLSVKPQEVAFTSGATEAINLIIRGLLGYDFSGHLITSGSEHSAVFNTAQAYQSLGMDVSFLSTGLWGAVTADQLRDALRPDTRLIALMAANNETGVKTDLEAIAAVAEEAGIPLFIDGVALIGKEEFSIPDAVCAMAFSAHKFHGPKGIGAAFIRKRLKLTPLLTGGGHEYKRRPGTENFLGIVGLGAAVERLNTELPAATAYMTGLRDRFEEGLRAAFPIVVNGEGPRVANTSNIQFPGVNGESLLMNLDLEGIAASHGSACTAGALQPSRTLLDMGLTTEEAGSSLRFALSRMTTEEEIDQAIAILSALLHRLLVK